MSYCLQNYIGLMGCSSAMPESGLYLNDLPGMSNELLQSIGSPDQKSYIETYNSIQRVTFQKLKSDLYTSLFSNGNVEMNAILHKSRPLQVINRQTVIPRLPSEEYRGAYVQVSGSKYLSIYCESILVYSASEYPIDAVLRVFQTQDGQELYTQDISLVQGVNNITVNQEFFLRFDALNLFFAIDCTEIETLQNPYLFDGFGLYGLDQCAAWAYPFWQYNGWFMWPATSGLDYIHGIPSQWGKQTGVWPLLEIRCSMDALICRFKEQLKMSIAYLLAAQTLETKQNTKQQNFFAQSSKEQTEKTRVNFLESYVSDLSAFARSINLQNEGFCFNCHQSRNISSQSLYA